MMNLQHKNTITYKFAKLEVDEAYWEKQQGFNFQSKSTTTPLEAITKGFESSKMSADCQVAGHMAVLLAAAKILGKDFNTLHGNAIRIVQDKPKESSLYQKHKSDPGGLAPFFEQNKKLNDQLKEVEKKAKTGEITAAEAEAQKQKIFSTAGMIQTQLNDWSRDRDNWIPGDLVTFSNYEGYEKMYPGGVWGGENTIYIGKDKDGTPRFSGAGCDNKTQKEVNDTLLAELEKDPNAVKAELARLAQLPQVMAVAEKNKVKPEIVAPQFYTFRKDREIGIVVVLRVWSRK
jgi:hypothetical protein